MSSCTVVMVILVKSVAAACQEKKKKLQNMLRAIHMLLFFLAASCSLVGSTSDYIPVIVEESGTEEVEKFATAIRFYLDVVNNGKESINVTVIPNLCCLIIEEGDIDCEVLELRPLVNLILGPKLDQFHGNNSGRVLFMFRNLYTRYRKGNCSFEITAEGESNIGFTHTLNFDTSPKDLYSTPNNCTGLDQDPDRGCSMVDCAIKYKGRRNFYRNSTGKCETVVDCDTRGHNGMEIIAYYDWDTNVCHRLDFKENTFSQVESDTEIPVEIDPSQSSYFPNLEPQRLKDIVDGESEKLECNNGVQNGIYCDCDKGWMSSGIRENDPLKFHWCDAQKVDLSGVPYRPIKLSKPVEITIIIILSLVNVSLTTLWFYVAYRVFLKDKCSSTCAKTKGSASYTLLQQN